MAERNKIVLLIAGVIIFGIAITLYNQGLQRRPQNYTVGEIIQIWKPARGEMVVGYTYSIGGEQYKNSVDLYGYESTAKIGKRFIVKFAENHAAAGIMLLDKPVPAKITAPTDGWDELPSF